ncbi:MAG: adenylyltransferase [Desulfatitalea sp. BRH_c12]|nr:MAG: adenylyltransferase [Desulfatitalea sp. BRH_c12]
MNKKSILNNIVLPIGDRISRQSVMKYYRLYSEMQWWPHLKLQEYQNNLFVKTINEAYLQVPFYRDLYDKSNIDMRKIKSLSDIGRLPILTKDMIRKNYPDKIVNKNRKSNIELFTSGSTGKPLSVRLDMETISAARALMLLRANFSGWEIGQPYLQTGMTLNRGWIRYAKDLLLGVHYVSAFDLTDDKIDLYLKIIKKHKLKYIMGYASSLYLIAKRAISNNSGIELKGAVSWGDNLFAQYRKVIENAFQCRVTDTYGCGEGIQIAAECEYGNYHIFMPHVHVEFLYENKNYTDEVGEILVTRLNAGAMPFIRYRIGDIGKKSHDSICKCGRSLNHFKSIEGRDSDIIVTPNGNNLIVHFFTGIFEYEKTVDTFQVVQNEIDSIDVKIVPMKGFTESIWEKIRNEIHTKGDPSLEINLEIVQSIPLEKSNKRRFVISRLNNNEKI